MADGIKYFLDWYKLTIFLASSAMNCIYEFHLEVCTVYSCIWCWECFTGGNWIFVNVSEIWNEKNNKSWSFFILLKLIFYYLKEYKECWKVLGLTKWPNIRILVGKVHLDWDKKFSALLYIWKEIHFLNTLY